MVTVEISDKVGIIEDVPELPGERFSGVALGVTGGNRYGSAH